MKKIIALFVVMLAFGVSANAQQKKLSTTAGKPKQEAVKAMSIEEAAQNDLNALTGVITNLTDTQKKDFYGLFEYKHREMKDMPAERRAAIAQVIDAKIKASLQPADIQKLENNPTVMRQLIN